MALHRVPHPGCVWRKALAGLSGFEAGPLSGLRRVKGAGVPRVQQPREGFAIGVISLHRRLEQGFLDVARHVSPDRQRGVTEQKCKSPFIILHRGSPHIRMRPRAWGAAMECLVKEQASHADVPVDECKKEIG